MADITVFIWHDEAGMITAFGTPHPEMAERMEPIATEGRYVLRTRIDAKELEQLDKTHQVDVKQRSLVPSSRN
jgi:hypothetical protein